MSTRYRRNPHTAGRSIQGLAFVITPDSSRLHTLNSTAARVWTLAEAGVTAEEAAQDLSRLYEVTVEQARRDLAQCLPDLVARQILVAIE
jgi:hypothetical protein